MENSIHSDTHTALKASLKPPFHGEGRREDKTSWYCVDDDLRVYPLLPLSFLLSRVVWPYKIHAFVIEKGLLIFHLILLIPLISFNAWCCYSLSLYVHNDDDDADDNNNTIIIISVSSSKDLVVRTQCCTAEMLTLIHIVSCWQSARHLLSFFSSTTQWTIHFISSHHKL